MKIINRIIKFLCWAKSLLVISLKSNINSKLQPCSLNLNSNETNFKSLITRISVMVKVYFLLKVLLKKKCKQTEPVTLLYIILMRGQALDLHACLGFNEYTQSTAPLFILGFLKLKVLFSFKNTYL